MNRWISIFASLCGFAIPALGQVSPEKAVATFKVADGLQLELFAHEPMVINPTSMDIDAKGRVWVCEAVNYRRVNFGRPILRPEGDRIQVLIDETGDGKATKAVTFYQGKEIVAPLGIAIAPYADGKGQKVFVCQSPDILVFEDKDGDLKADGPPKKLLSGFGGIDHDHGVHGINIGPDGKLYFTVGDAGVHNLQASDGKGPKFSSNGTDCRAGTVWRCDMDGTDLELIAHNFRNNYECCVNSFGEIWLSDNDDDGNQQTRICYVMPGGNYGYHPRGPGQSHWHEEQPGIVHKTLRTGFGSPTGICFYEGSLLPKKYQGQLLHCDAGPREFRCFHIKPKGAGYELDKELLVTSTDNWFRLSAVRVAPDGSVFLADWYDPGVGGHGMGDWTRGRIYRITPKGHKGYEVPVVEVSTKEGLLKAFVSPCLATRSLVRENLKKMGSEEGKEILEAFASQSTKAPIDLTARAWFQAPCVSKTDFKDLAQAVQEMLKVSSPDLIKIAGIRLDEGVRASDGERMHVWERMPNLLEKPSTPVARELLLAFRNEPVDRIKVPFFTLAKLYDGQDIFYRAALNIACGTDPKRRDAILADFDKHFPVWNDKVADLVWELRPKSVMPGLAKRVADPQLTASQRKRIVDILASSEDLTAGQTMLAMLGKETPPEVRDEALKNLQLFLPGKWKALAGSKEFLGVIDPLFAEPTTRLAGLRLIAAAGLTEKVETVRKFYLDETKPELRVEAIRTLGKLPSIEAVKALATIGAGTDGIEAIAALGLHLAPNPKKATPTATLALETLQGVIANPKAATETKLAALSALAGNPTGTQWLLDSHEKKQLPENLVADTGRLLRNSPFQGLRNKAMLLFPAPGKLDPKKLPPIAELAKRTGNADRGKALLASSLKGEAQCLRCHMVQGSGGNIGPDLSMIGKKGSRENIYESILQPSKAIADQYLQWNVTTLNGLKVTGLLVEEDNNKLVLRDANGKDFTLAKNDIEEKNKSTISIMPDNLVSVMTEDNLIDLVEYLVTLKTASLTPENWYVIGPFENDANDSALDKDFGLEKAKAIDLKATLSGKSGPVTWKTVRTSATGYVDLQAHFAPNSTGIGSYVYRQVDSPVEQSATILLGNDDGAKIWVNGSLIFTNRDHNAATPDYHKVPITLKKGPNTILMKIVNGNNPHGFYLRVTSEQELKLLK